MCEYNSKHLPPSLACQLALYNSPFPFLSFLPVYPKVSTELNEAETMLQPKQSADNCEPASVTGSRQEPKGQSPIEDQEIEEATTETAENGLVSVSSSTDSSPSSCAPENGSSITRPAPVQVGSLTRPLGRHLSAVKRFLNRFILISTSHYRSYELTPCEVLPPGAMAATQPETETALATSPTLEPSLDVIHSNSEQVRKNSVQGS